MATEQTTHSPERDPTAGLDAGEVIDRESRRKPGADDSVESQEQAEREERESREEDERRAAAEAAAPVVDEDEERRASEARARKLGWVPLDEFKGDKSKWRPADEWLERGLGNNVILRDLNEKLDRQNDLLARRLTEMEQRQKESSEVLQELHGRNQRADQAGYNRAIREVEARKREAVAEADTDKFDQAERDLKALQENPPATRTPPAEREPEKKPEPPTAPHPEVVAWAEEPGNKRILNDQSLFNHLHAIDLDLVERNKREGRTPSPGEHLREAAAELRRLYPERFENERRSAPSTVRTPAGDRSKPNGAGKRTFANLPPEAKRAFEKSRNAMGPDKKTGKPYFTEEMFLSQYAWDE